MHEAGACVNVCFTCGDEFLSVGFGGDGFVVLFEFEFGDCFVDIVGSCFGGVILGGDVFVAVVVIGDSVVDVVLDGRCFCGCAFWCKWSCGYGL